MKRRLAVARAKKIAADRKKAWDTMPAKQRKARLDAMLAGRRKAQASVVKLERAS